MNRIYTIGHSNHDWTNFLSLLHRHGVSALADVRSQPFSRRFPQYSKSALQSALSIANIAYVYLGKELGARSKDLSCYIDGQVDFELVTKTRAFQIGVDRLREGSKCYSIALMCAEREPLDCHRMIMVARHLQDAGLDVIHILSDGSLETQAAAELRLLSQLRIPDQDMFRGLHEAVADAYRLRGKQIAFRQDEEEILP